MKTNIIKLSKNHIIPAGAVLGRALKDDPVSVHVTPDEVKRHLTMECVFRMTCYLGVKYGEVYATSADLEGVAVWIPYEYYKDKFWRNLKAAFKGRMWKMGLDASRNIKPIREYSTAAHRKYAPTNHWYLQSLGVEPIHQGKGYGSLLLEHFIEKIATDSLPIFLETSTQRNVNFYERFGFQVMEEEIVPGTNVRQWYLLRK